MLSGASMPMAVRVSIVAAPKVWQQECVLHRQISRIQLRFSLVRVQAGRCDLATLEGSNQILIDHHATSGSVHNDCAPRQARNCFGVEEVVGLLCFGCVQAQKWADSEQIIGLSWNIASPSSSGDKR